MSLIVLPVNVTDEIGMFETDFIATSLTLESRRKKLKTRLSTHADKIRLCHPDGEGIGEDPDCPCRMCERVQKPLVKTGTSRYIRTAATNLLQLMESMTCCDQRNVQEYLKGLPYWSCEPDDEMGPSDMPGCRSCAEFNNLFLEPLKEASREERLTIRNLLKSKPVSADMIPDVIIHHAVPTMIQVLYYGTPEFVSKIYSLIYFDKESFCECDRCYSEHVFFQSQAAKHTMSKEEYELATTQWLMKE
jgi:hypothetical protein